MNSPNLCSIVYTGKFAKNPITINKVPSLVNGVVKYTVPKVEIINELGQKEMVDKVEIKDSVYTALGSFITSWARYKTITTAQKLYDRFIYSDTDSIHLLGDEEPDIDIHPTNLGAWKFEGRFIDSKFLRAKTYIEVMYVSEEKYNKMTDEEKEYIIEVDGEKGIMEVKCAGMPENVKKQVNLNNFTEGAIFSGKLLPKRVDGGVVLEDTEFTIKRGL